MAATGKLLEAALYRLSKAENAEERAVVAAHVAGAETDDQLPIVVKLETMRPAANEPWADYRDRVEAKLETVSKFMSDVMGVPSDPLIAGNSLAASVTPDQISKLSEQPDVDLIELDPLVQLEMMDDAVVDVALPTLQVSKPALTGAGVSVAVLDSGIDIRHPHLVVADSVSTCGESTDIPGSHGTHCAGSVASRDAAFPGIAPEVTLINVKVLRADGSGRHSFITRGIDEALDRDAEVLSMSIGFNHLPTWAQNGHGWSCPDGLCPLCTAVDNAVALDNVVAVVAAANEHRTAENLRQFGYGNTFDTELGCPGQAREALTVGAITKRTFLPADFSSRGPTAYGADKPDLAAPGVNITSTVPVPRDSKGKLRQNPARSQLFGRKSGTSMATPIVAGAVALTVQQEKIAGRNWTPASIRTHLLRNGIAALGFSANVVGAGRLDLTNL